MQITSFLNKYLESNGFYTGIPHNVGKFLCGHDLDPFRQNQNILWIMLIKVNQLKLEFKYSSDSWILYANALHTVLYEFLNQSVQ